MVDLIKADGKSIVSALCNIIIIALLDLILESMNEQCACE